MLFDIDDPDRWEYDVDGPIPNWQVRKDSQPTTYHVAFALENPVARHDAANPKPLRFFRNVYEGLSVLFGADYRYSGLMTKNPLQPAGRLLHPVVPSRTLHPARTPRLAAPQDPETGHPHRRRPQRGPLPLLHQAGPPAQVGQDHFAPRTQTANGSITSAS